MEKLLEVNQTLEEAVEAKSDVETQVEEVLRLLAAQQGTLRPLVFFSRLLDKAHHLEEREVQFLEKEEEGLEEVEVGGKLLEVHKYLLLDDRINAEVPLLLELQRRVRVEEEELDQELRQSLRQDDRFHYFLSLLLLVSFGDRSLFEFQKLNDLVHLQQVDSMDGGLVRNLLPDQRGNQVIVVVHGGLGVLADEEVQNLLTESQRGLYLPELALNGLQFPHENGSLEFDAALSVNLHV